MPVCTKCKKRFPKSYFEKGKVMCKRCKNCREKVRKWGDRCEICKKRASFNFEDEKKGIRCKKHILEGMVDVKHAKCQECKEVRPNYGYEKATHCVSCKEEDMKDFHTLCENCKEIRVSYGYKKATHCSSCKLPGMICFIKKCFCGSVLPSFGYKQPTHCKKCKDDDMILIKRNICYCGEGTKRFGLKDFVPTHCHRCKTDDMINLVDDMCECGKTCLFGYIGSKATHCFTCKTQHMINLKNVRCNCGKFAYYGKESAKTHCKDCKTNDMKLLIEDKRICGCGKRSSFGIKGEKPTCCKNCKTEGMVRIYDNTCECGTRVSYGYEKPTHCVKCKLPEMTNLTKRFCDYCQTRASYGFPLNYPTKCAQHKQDGMILNPTKKCSMCTEKAKYGIKQAIHCEKHKKQNEIDLVERKCKKCGRIDVVNSEQLCINFCLLNTKGYEIYKKYRKEKQERVVKLLKEKVGNPTSIDRIIDTECGKERPDIVYDCKTHSIIVEVDEHKHRGYKCKDGVDGEKMRMINLYMALGFEKLLFIRYNPDSYKGEDGKILRTQLYIRERVLVKCVKHYMKNIDSVQNLGVLYLYYNGFNEQRSKIVNIDPYTEYNGV